MDNTITRQIKFTLDCSKTGSQICIEGIRQYEINSVQFVITLRNGPDSFITADSGDLTAILYGTKPDKTGIIITCTVEEDKTITCTLSSVDTSCAGVITWYLQIEDDTGEIISIASEFCTVVEPVSFDFGDLDFDSAILDLENEKGQGIVSFIFSFCTESGCVV